MLLDSKDGYGSKSNHMGPFVELLEFYKLILFPRKKIHVSDCQTWRLKLKTLKDRTWSVGPRNRNGFLVNFSACFFSALNQKTITCVSLFCFRMRKPRPPSTSQKWKSIENNPCWSSWSSSFSSVVSRISSFNEHRKKRQLKRVSHFPNLSVTVTALHEN